MCFRHSFYVSSPGQLPWLVVQVLFLLPTNRLREPLCRTSSTSHIVNKWTATAMLGGNAGKQVQRTPTDRPKAGWPERFQQMSWQAPSLCGLASAGIYFGVKKTLVIYRPFDRSLQTYGVWSFSSSSLSLALIVQLPVFCS